MTSNGVGMGHLTRLLAVATRLPGQAGGAAVQPVFASLSKGVHVVERFGIPHTYIPSGPALAMEPQDWELYLRRRLARLLDDVAPDVVVFDGVHPYDGLIENLRVRGTGTGDEGALRAVWMRRAMWRPESSARALGRARHFDLVIEPGDHASSYDSGVTTSRQDAHRVAPITLLSADQLLSREQARVELGYGEQEKVALITLGAGNIRDLGPVQSRVLEWFSRHAPDWRPVLTKAPISEAGPAQYSTLQAYPLARYTRAFDAAMSSCGYNAFHEWTAGALPTLWVPITETPTDDQAARAQWAADHGMSLTLGSVTGAEAAAALEDGLRRLTDGDARTRMEQKLLGLPGQSGAQEAAQLIVGLAS